MRVRAPQSGRWYHKDWRGCTSTEVYVLTFLVLRSEADGVALRWAKDVLADVTGYVDGEPWKAPWAPAAARQLVQQFEYLLRDITTEDAQAAGEAAERAAARPDGDGVPPGETELRAYLKAFFTQKEDKHVLLGAGGGATYKKGAPLRRVYLMPRVAALVRDANASLMPALGDARDVVITRAAEQCRRARGDVPGKVEPSPVKATLKARLAEGVAAQRTVDLDQNQAGGVSPVQGSSKYVV